MVPTGELRVAWVVGRLNVGGPAVHILAAATALRRLGVRSLILAGEPGPAEGDLCAEVEARGLEVLRIPALQRALSPSADVRALNQLRAGLARFAPHVVQTQTAKAGALGRIAAATLARRPPLVVHTFHGHVFRHYFGAAASRSVLVAERALAHLCDAVVAISAAQARELAALGFAPAPLPVVPVGIELDALIEAHSRRGGLRRELGIDAATPIVASVGRLIEIKRVRQLIEACAALRATGMRLSLVLAGDGDQRAALERAAREAGLAGSVFFLGWRRDLAQVYADVDVFALASRSEGTPVAVMEAMAAGCAVVASRVGGVPDLVDDQRTGLLVSPENPAALRDALGALLSDPARRAALGAQGQVAARERFDVAHTTRVLLDFYLQRLAEEGGRRLR